VVDVAGGNGALLSAILEAHPAMHGILFDVPATLGPVMSDLHMTVALGGRERTIAEYVALLMRAGLRMTRPITMDSDFYGIEAVSD
jgi:O-methyltransferase domain